MVSAGATSGYVHVCLAFLNPTWLLENICLFVLFVKRLSSLVDGYKIDISR